MMRWFRRRKRAEWLACQELVELVTDYLEGALTPDLLEAFRTHISECGNCAEYLHQMRRTIDLGRLTGAEGGEVTDVPPDPAASPMLDDLLAEFRARHPR